MVTLRAFTLSNRDKVLFFKYMSELYESIKLDAYRLGIKDDLVYTDEDFLRHVTDSSVSIYFIVLDNKEEIGVLKLRTEGSDLKVSSFYISNEYRNRGYGLETLSLIEKEEKRVLTLDVWYEGKAFDLYNRFGFKTESKLMTHPKTLETIEVYNEAEESILRQRGFRAKITRMKKGGI